MKRLTRIKLIHWHYFINDTININGSLLLTGENGSGKSTILDAIQFALVADQRKVRFNVSAHEETKRDLRGYIRGKTGSDTEGGSPGYLREDQDFSSYVALEFYDTRARAYFLVGTVIDSYSSGDQDVRFFKLENLTLEEELFFEGARPRNVSEFRRHVCQRPGGKMYPTAESYRSDLLTKLGHLNERFFALLVKALAFKPITNIRDFVYLFLLEERSVNIESMRQNLQNYRQFEALVDNTKKRIESLEAISSTNREIQEYQRRIRIQDYVIRKAEHNEAASSYEVWEGQVSSATKAIESCREAMERLNGEKVGLEQRKVTLQDAIMSHSTRRLIDEMEVEIQRLEASLSTALMDQAELERMAQDEAEALDQLTLLLPGSEEWAGPQEARCRDLNTLKGVFQRLLQPESPVDDLREDLDLLAEVFREMGRGLQDRRSKLLAAREKMEHEVHQIEKDLKALRERRRVYDEALLRLRRAIEEEVQMDGEPVRTRVFCELLEVPNDQWQDAVEGYLNTQRFDLMVPPNAFDEALAVYERRKVEHRIANIGLVNGARIMAESRPPLPGSLAEEVHSEDPLARAYADRLLGHVMKCGNEQELKRHRVAITPTCMTYRNHVARQINFSVYETWYIGERSFGRQIELKTRRLKELQAHLEGVVRQIAQSDTIIGLLGDRRDRFSWMLRHRENASKVPHIQAEIARQRSELEQVDTSGLRALEAQLEETQRDLQRTEANLLEHSRTLGSVENELRHARTEAAKLQDEVQEKREALERYARDNPGVVEEGERRWGEAVRANDAKTVKENFERSRKQHETRASEAYKALFEMRSTYNHTHHFGAAPNAPDNTAYEAELEKLAKSELPSYQESIIAARQAAEEEFKEHFVYRLREHIETAKQQFKELNTVLREIRFGQDRYQFQVQKAPDYAHFHDMITDETLMHGHSLFSQEFQERHKATIDQFFNEILEAPEDEQARNIEKFTDYRTYLDYDIKIHHDNGEVSTFSRVAREKSGGESQTPYYVAIVASFLHLYRYRHNEDSVRLMMFDEAFNRMDLDRIEKTLQFIGQLGLQLICASPTDKAEIITPYVGTTILVIRDGHRTWLQDYHILMQEAAMAEAMEGRS